MIIDWQQFTPDTALLGGSLIGLASVLLMWFTGKIAGISGIIGVLFNKNAPDKQWRIAFIIGLLLSGVVALGFGFYPKVKSEIPTIQVILAGLCVGIGTRYAMGCTSGHGVCGLSRLSLRSLVATLTFMATGFLTVYLTRHFL